MNFRASCSSSLTSACAAKVVLVRDITFLGGNVGPYTDENTSSAGFQTSVLNEPPFTGYIDGGSHAISGLYITSTTPAVFNGNAFTQVGGVVSLLNSPGIIRDIGFTNGWVKGEDNVSGIVGKMGTGTKVYHSYSAVPITLSAGSIQFRRVAGIAAYMEASTLVEGCYNTGLVTSLSTDKAFSAGIAGENLGTVKLSFNTGNITTGVVANIANEGGVVAWNRGSVSDVYNTGQVTGMGAGGVAGDNAGTLIRSYNVGKIVLVTPGNDPPGSVIAWAEGNCTNVNINNYFLSTASLNSGIPSVGTHVGGGATCPADPVATTSVTAMKTASTFSAFTFWNGTTGAWDILPTAGSYPYLRGITPTAMIPQ